jgi:hypothetical protein
MFRNRRDIDRVCLIRSAGLIRRRQASCTARASWDVSAYFRFSMEITLGNCRSLGEPIGTRLLGTGATPRGVHRLARSCQYPESNDDLIQNRTTTCGLGRSLWRPPPQPSAVSPFHPRFSRSSKRIFQSPGNGVVKVERSHHLEAWDDALLNRAAGLVGSASVLGLQQKSLAKALDLGSQPGRRKNCQEAASVFT